MHLTRTSRTASLKITSDRISPSGTFRQPVSPEQLPARERHDGRETSEFGVRAAGGPKRSVSPSVLFRP